MESKWSMLRVATCFGTADGSIKKIVQQKHVTEAKDMVQAAGAEGGAVAWST